MRVLILISGVFFLINLMLFLLPTDIETSNLKYASQPEVNQDAIQILLKDKPTLGDIDVTSLPNISESDSTANSKYKINPSGSISAVPACYRIGPFLRESRVQSASKQIKDLLISYDVVERQSTSVDASRVYVGPFMGVSEAVAARKQLSEEGFDDHFHRKDSNGEFIVSLGIYSKHESALSQQVKFRDRNIAARIRKEKTRLPKNYWIELSPMTRESKLKLLTNIEWGERSVSAGMHPCQAKV